MEYVNYEEFKKMDIRVGTIREVESVAGTDKLLCCMVDFGEMELRQIVSGIHEFYPEYEKLIGKQVLYIVNLEPRIIKGTESNGMLMAVDGPSTTLGINKPVFLIPETEVNAGSKVR